MSTAKKQLDDLRGALDVLRLAVERAHDLWRVPLDVSQLAERRRDGGWNR